ncbi:MAG TPA: A24 family peptidase [Candidatus Polarisedimenticolia bacterium]|nr:A24 family peptidase [Candidatus Polarisedimenticolia bacterium]
MLTAAAIVNISAVAVAVAAATTDIRSKRVPNALVLSAAAMGLALNCWRDGLGGAAAGFAGGVVGLAVFLPFFMAGGMGGGDVKLCAALGTFFGPIGIVQASLAASVAGGACAIFVAARRRQLRATLCRTRDMLLFGTAGDEPHETDTTTPAWARPGAVSIPYAVPIAAGTLVAAVVNWSW